MTSRVGQNPGSGDSPQERHDAWSAEHQLSGERLSTIVHSLDVIIWEFDAIDLTTSYVSPQIEEMFGYTLQDAHERPYLWHEILHPDDREQILESCREHTREGRSHELEYRVVKADGEVRWVHDIATYVKNERRTDQLRCVFIDVTERREAVERLEKSRERLATAQHIANVGDWEWNIDTDEVRWSDETFRIFGMVPQSLELTYEDFLEMLPSGSERALSAATERALAHDVPYSFDQYITLPNGEPRIVHFEGEVLRDDDGEPHSMRGTIQEVTDVRRSEGKHHRLGRILEHSASEVLLFDADTLQIEQANRASRENLGYGFGEIEGASIFDILASLDDRETFDHLTHKLRERSDDVVRFKDQARRHDGTSYPVEVQLLYSGLDLTPVYVVIMEDTSGRQEVERLKDEFLGLVSHELRTPLTPLIGLLDVMRKEIDPVRQPRMVRMLDVARSNSERMLALVNDLLDLRRLTVEPEQALEFYRHDMRDVLQESVRENQALFLNRELSYSLRLPDEPVYASVDRRRIGQVLTNLISNAARFSSPGGMVDIELTCERDQAVARVRDFGRGIHEEFQPFVFDKFTQEKSPMRRDHPGAGLGLALAKMLVEKHGGEIAFDSTPGEGSTFCVRLPLSMGA